MNEEILQDHWVLQVQEYRFLGTRKRQPVELHPRQRRVRRQGLPQPIHLRVRQLVLKQVEPRIFNLVRCNIVVRYVWQIEPIEPSYA